MQFLAVFTIAVISVFFYYNSDDAHCGKLQSFYIALFFMSITSIIAILFQLLVTIDEKTLPFCFSLKMKLFFWRKVRISIAYLYNIPIKDKYLFITNSYNKGSKTERITPIGGAYKYYDTALLALQELKATPSLKKDFKSKDENDLRLVLPAKNVNTFFKLYNKKKGFEYSPLREFDEELFKTDDNQNSEALLTNKELFSNIRCSKLKSHYRITRNKQYDKNDCENNFHYEVHFFDIFFIDLTKEQKTHIEERMYEIDHTNKMFLYCVSECEIMNDSFVPKKKRENILKLGDNAKYILINYLQKITYV